MPRPAQTVPSRKLTVMLPADKLIRLELYLFSVALGRVPQGAYQAWIVERLDEFFAKFKAEIDAEIATKTRGV